MRGRLFRLILTFPALLLLAGCTDEPLTGDGDMPSPGADLSKFWYSRTRSAVENKTMLRHHALGFSYQAVSGKKCNISDVMCQVFNLDYLKENGLLSRDNTFEMSGEHHVERGVADIVHGTKWITEFSGDALLYKKDKVKAYDLIESINDSTIVMHNTVKFRRGASHIKVDLLSNPDEEGEINDLYDYDKVFSDNFRYAVAKLKSNKDNVAVIDSFLNIFGTHVVTGIEVGGKCDIAVKTSKRLIHTYLEEQEYSRDAVNLFFKKKETIEKLSNQKNYVNLFRTAEIDLTIRGGDISRFDPLVANPSYDNALASDENFDAWSKSVAEAGDSWDEGMELIDMNVSPIYNFITDRDLANRVKVRMEASAQDMRDLYGELNFTSAEITLPSDPWGSFIPDFIPNCIGNPQKLIEYDNLEGYCHTIQEKSSLPSKIVAVTYNEDIPDVGYFPVTYPVYENRIQMTEGIAYTHNGYYSVKWLYDHLAAEKIPGNPGPHKLYLYKGRLFTGCPVGGETWMPAKTMLDYEWAGSLDLDGEQTGGSENVYLVYKKENRFYLLWIDNIHSQSGNLPNLPGWSYDKIQNRMVRNDNYRYKIMPKELKAL